MTLWLSLRSFYLWVEQVHILGWTLKCDHLLQNSRCQKVLVGNDDTGAESENLYSEIIPCLHFPPSWLILLALFSSSTLLLSLVLVWQRNEDLDIIEREESWLAVQHSLVPVLVDLISQSDDIALAEAQLSLVFWLKVVQRLTARLLQGW